MNENEKTVRLPWFGIPKVLPYAKKYAKLIVIMMLLGALTSVIDSAFPLFHRYALNHYVGEGVLDTVAVFAALYVGILLVQVAANFISTYLSSKVELGVGRDLKNAAFTHLQTLSFSYFNQNSVGYVHARVMSDTDLIGTLLSWRIMDFVWNFSYIVCVFVVMLTINRSLAFVLLMLVPIAALFIALFQKKLIGLNRKVREINSRITGNFNEGITGAQTIRTLVIEEKIGREFEKDTEDMRCTAVRSAHVSALFVSVVTLLSSIALALVLWQGGQLTREAVMEIGTLSVFMSYAIGIMDPIQYLIEMFTAIIQTQANIERFTTLMGTQPDVKDTPEVLEKYGDVFTPKKENWEDLSGDITFEDVSFRYPDGEELVLDHFTLHVPKGTSVAIVGETGAGKSTLVNLVCRFYEPTKGRVLIDGRDARERSQLWLHSHIGYVLQSPHLFSGSVRDNMRYGKPDATDEEIWAALALVSADEVVRRMGDGLSSEVGEGGSLLSTGEKQLISFARAIIADPAILVLDEATSSIDTVTEKAIQEAVGKVIRGRTSFMVAHRLSTVVDADVILAVRDGKIVEMGRHEELMARNGYYSHLFRQQYEESEQKVAFARGV
ncbi:MAG: ABC transporter ATP-binding protein [Lachnospiraceae bacterium]|nr:ABC transporter ATP-binding protein [Lachnospiraceae bacterium]